MQAGRGEGAAGRGGAAQQTGWEGVREQILPARVFPREQAQGLGRARRDL